MNRLILFLILIVFTSCTISKYQVVQMASNLEMDENEEFVFENDTLKIAYSFAGESGPFQMIVFNDSQKPLYVNWDKSSLIINGSSMSINAYKSPIRLDEFGIEIPPNNTNEAIELIAPQSFVRKEIYYHTGDFLSTQGLSFEEMKRNDPLKGRNVTVKHYQFDESKSNLKVRNYLLLSRDRKFDDFETVDAHFWVTDIFDTDSKFILENLINSQKVSRKGLPKPNTFFFAQHEVVGTGFGTALLVLGILALAIVVSE
jgi:hypothetical protein